MKRIAFLITLLSACMFEAQKAAAQSPIVMEHDKMVITGSEGRNIVDIRTDRSDENLVIRVASMEIVMGNSRPDYSKTAAVTYNRKPARVAFGSSSFQSFFEIGINTLPCPDYSHYADLPEGLHDFLDLRNAKSLQFSFSLGDVTLYLNRQRNLSFTTALQVVFDEYVFSQDVRLAKDGGMIVPVPISPHYKKSKLSVASLQIPVVFTLGKSGSFHVSLGLYGGLRIGNHTKIKFPKEKAYDMYMAPFYGGVTARAGFRGLYVYCNYGLSDMFKKGKGPGASPLTAGLGLGF